MKISKDINNEKTFITPIGKSIINHFVFDLTRSKLHKKFSREFAKLIPDIKDLKMPECHQSQMNLESKESKEQHHLDSKPQ